MKNNKTAIIIASVAVALTAVICAVVLVHFSGKKAEAPSTTAEQTADVFNPVTELTALPETLPSIPESTPSVPESQTAPTEQPSVTDVLTTVVQSTNKAFKEVFRMPTAPKYVEPDTDIDFETAKVLSYKYDPDGGYFYTDDKECWQRNFGFNEGYDSMAPLGMMNYDTVRVKFTYDNKEWLVQMWKGQYGYAFVGGEVGVYTRKVGAGGTHYNCAKQEDWLNMEMAFVWDKGRTGNYQTVFVRDYTQYWWCTGFVPGLETGAPRDQFRLITHITFKSTEMAELFCQAFEKQGFTRVAKLNNNEIDTFVQVGADVAFVWQDIADN
ncbi:MAG: DUF4474 domain-containing protein [Clostridia bacterium]|nr:DUF4474 domain-containing protein [Clostridia bacterium]